MHVLIVILILSGLVILHELGHYLAALFRGVGVKEFGIGYPPKLATFFTYKGTKFTLNLIPFGGFVRLEGENGPSENQEESFSEFEPSSSEVINTNSGEPFYCKSIIDRLIIILAGVTFNLIFAFAAFSLAYSFLGIPTVLENQARVVFVAPDSPAKEVGFPDNVNILEISIDEKTYSISSPNDVIQAVGENKGQTLSVLISGECDGLECGDETTMIDLYARTEEETPEGDGSIGIGFTDSVFHHYPWYEMPFRGIWYGAKQSFELGWMIIVSLSDMFVQLFTKGTVPQDVAGPVGIVHHAQQGHLISENHWYNVGFAAMLSLNLAIINLLPIPALDGGRALFIFLEKFVGKKKIRKIEGLVNYAGLAILLVLIVAITISDVGKIVGFGGK